MILFSERTEVTIITSLEMSSELFSSSSCAHSVGLYNVFLLFCCLISTDFVESRVLPLSANQSKSEGGNSSPTVSLDFQGHSWHMLAF